VTVLVSEQSGVIYVPDIRHHCIWNGIQFIYSTS